MSRSKQKGRPGPRYRELVHRSERRKVRAEAKRLVREVEQ